MSKSKQTKAVALKYNAEADVAPVVIASGYGTIAEKIIDIAEQKGIPVFRDDSAASLMCMLEVGSNIPPELYEVIAAIYLQLLKTSAEIKSTEFALPGRKATMDERLNRLAERSTPRRRRRPSAASAQTQSEGIVSEKVPGQDELQKQIQERLKEKME